MIYPLSDEREGTILLECGPSTDGTDSSQARVRVAEMNGSSLVTGTCLRMVMKVLISRTVW